MKMMSRIAIVCVIMSILMSQTVFARSFSYSSESNGSPCILLDITFTMVVTAYNGDLEISTSRTESDVKSVLGSCDHTVMALTFHDETHWVFWFHQNSDGTERLDSSVLFAPNSVFQNNMTGLDVISLEDAGTLELYKTVFSYQCETLGLIQYTKKASTPGKPNYIVQVTVSSIHVQGFDVKGGSSGLSIWCLVDNTTTTTSSLNSTGTTSSSHENTSNVTNTSSSTESTVSQSTDTTFDNTTVAPTTPSRPPVNNYTVPGDNVTCILLQGAFQVNINYKTNASQASTNTVSVDIPAGAKGTGNCNQTLDSQNLIITFLDDWLLEFVFTLEDPSAAAATSDASYGITNITLTYVVNPEIFPDSIIPPNTRLTVFPRSSSEADYPRKASSKASYKCNSNIDIPLQAGVTLQTSELEFKAFNTNDNITFAGDAENCLADEPTSHTVPVIVGCSLAGIGVLATTVYAIGKCRNRQRRSYLGI